ncbi:MAG: aldo/keto reductase [Verrucomicrobia bacterium]|nr:aldo/keto reductase [Verrucomicrobiota bacterium]
MLGRTGLKVSVLSYGTGGPGGFGRARGLTAGDQKALIRRCLDLGINLFDTAEAYGGGQSETDLGGALQGVPRDTYILATKWLHHDGNALTVKEDPAALAASVERSLARLRTDYIDIMQFHGLSPTHYRQVVDRFYPEMEKLKKSGKLRFVGFSEFLRSDAEHAAIAMALKNDPELWDTVMLKYGILYQWAAREVLPLAISCKTGVLNMAPVRLSLSDSTMLERLVAKWEADGLLERGSLSRREPLGWLIGGNVGSLVAAAYKFAADHRGISTVLTGTSDIAHLEENAAALESPVLPPADKDRLVRLFGNRPLPFTP